MMMRAKILAIAGLLTLGVAGAEILYLHRDTAKLSARATALRGRNAAVTRLAQENQRTRELVTRAETDATDAAQAFHQDVVQLREEVRALEEKARAAATQRAAAAAAIAMNRDPARALTRLENFQNVGRGTPEAAIQTLMWAALKGDEPTLVASLALSDDAREKALQVLAHLPESARAKYPAPENLAALVVTDQILRADAVQIVSATPVDAQHAIVNVRLAGTDGEEKIPTELGVDGWKVTIPKKLISALYQRLNPPAPAPAPKK